MTFIELMTETGFPSTLLMIIVLIGSALMLASGREHPHRTTDPACRFHTARPAWWADLQRGKACPVCMRARTFARVGVTIDVPRPRWWQR